MERTCPRCTIIIGDGPCIYCDAEKDGFRIHAFRGLEVLSVQLNHHLNTEDLGDRWKGLQRGVQDTNPFFFMADRSFNHAV